MEEKTTRRKTKASILTATVIMLAVIVGSGIYNAPDRRFVRQLDLGHRYLEEQNYEQAVVAFMKAIEIEPMRVEAYLGLVDAYTGAGDNEKALKALQKGYDLTKDERLRQRIEEIEDLVRKEVVWNVKRKDFSYRDSNGDVLMRIYYDLAYTDSKYEHCKEINAILKKEYHEFAKDVPDMGKIDGVLDLQYASAEYPYIATVETEVTYADENILSIKHTSFYYMGGTGHEDYSGKVFSLDTGKEITAQELYKLDEDIVTAYFKFEVMEYINMNDNNQRPMNEDAYDVVAQYKFEDFSFYLKDGYPVLCFETYLLSGGVGGSFEMPCRLRMTDIEKPFPASSLVGSWFGGDNMHEWIYSMTFQKNSDVEYMVGWGGLYRTGIIGEVGYVYRGTYDVGKWDNAVRQGDISIQTTETMGSGKNYDATYNISALGENIIAVKNISQTLNNEIYSDDKVVILIRENSDGTPRFLD